MLISKVSGYEADNDHFDNFGAALLSLFILTTEENFPTVADPSFSQRPLVSWSSEPSCSRIGTLLSRCGSLHHSINVLCELYNIRVGKIVAGTIPFGRERLARIWGELVHVGWESKQ